MTGPDLDADLGALDDLDDLVRRWAAGWAAARRVGPPTPNGDALQVEPLNPHRRLELVLGAPARSVVEHHAARVRGTDDVWLTVFTHEPPSWPAPAGLVALRDDEVLMDRPLASSRPPDSRVTLDVDGRLARASVVLDGIEAASGLVAVVGTDAVVDRVETSPVHRRQGLGTAVMTALTTWAFEQGATTGLLAASSAGHALYVTLGWRVAARMTTYAASGSGSGSGSG